MKKEIIKAKCLRMDPEGNGVIGYKGTNLPVPYLIEGEEAVIQIHRHKDQVFGKLVEMTKKSPLRVEPPCPYYYHCGGCQLQHLSTEAQNAFKQKVVEEALSSFGKVEPLMTMADPYHYRNKSHTNYVNNRGAISSGIYEAYSHKVTAIDQCMIQNEKADAITLTIRGLLPSFKLMPYDENSGQGFLRHVLVRTGHTSGQIMVVLVAATQVFPSKNNFVKKLLSLHPEITTLLLNVNSKKTSMVLGNEDAILFGEGYIEDTLSAYTSQISPKSFYQINPVQTEYLYNKAFEYAGLTGNETVLDAYSGIGTLSLIASKNAKSVVGVELNGDAIRDAIYNAKNNQVTNVRFVKGDAGQYMLTAAEEKQNYDLVIMDPPRSGSDLQFLSSLLKMAPKKIMYISCNPQTLKRDLTSLVGGGYKVTGIQPVDLFPQTFHVEAIILMTRSGSGDKK